jgi:hypothetical protein
MEGWSEEEIRNKGLMAPCGSYCGACGVYIATRDGNEKFKAIIEWPCDMIENFPFATGVRVMKRTIPLWRASVAEHADDKGSVEWARAECERYHCPSCGKPLFRGA